MIALVDLTTPTQLPWKVKGKVDVLTKEESGINYQQVHSPEIKGEIELKGWDERRISVQSLQRKNINRGDAGRNSLIYGWGKYIVPMFWEIVMSNSSLAEKV